MYYQGPPKKKILKIDVYIDISQAKRNEFQDKLRNCIVLYPYISVYSNLTKAVYALLFGDTPVS